jgi:hypothetical protein
MQEQDLLEEVFLLSPPCIHNSETGAEELNLSNSHQRLHDEKPEWKTN